MELLRRGYSVTVGKVGSKEIDFVCEDHGNKLYVQVAYLLASEDTIQREFGVYDHVRDNFPKYVVTLDEFDMSRNGIKHRNIRDFLLEDEWNKKNNSITSKRERDSPAEIQAFLNLESLQDCLFFKKSILLHKNPFLMILIFFLVILSPDFHSVNNRPHRFAQFAQSVFHSWRHFRINRAGNNSILLHGTQTVRQNFLADPIQIFSKFIETPWTGK